MNEKVITLHRYQVEDIAKGSFYVGLEATKERHRGETVYKDKVGRRLVILEDEA